MAYICACVDASRTVFWDRSSIQFLPSVTKLRRLFLHMSVSHSVHREGGLPQSMLGYHTPPGSTHPPWRWLPLRTVCILLECILVLKFLAILGINGQTNRLEPPLFGLAPTAPSPLLGHPGPVTELSFNCSCLLIKLSKHLTRPGPTPNY